MKTFAHSKKPLYTFIYPSLLVILIACSYKERGHANTPAEYPGSQTNVGPDTLVHPGNIDKDTIKLEN